MHLRGSVGKIMNEQEFIDGLKKAGIKKVDIKSILWVENLMKKVEPFVDYDLLLSTAINVYKNPQKPPPEGWIICD